MNFFRRVLVSFLVILFSLSPIEWRSVFYALASPDEWADPERYIFISEDTTWKSGETLVFNKDVAIDDGATLTIEPGAKIIFGWRERGWGTASLNVSNGNVIAEGTPGDPIIFETAHPEWERLAINFFTLPENSASFFRYVEFRDGGESYSTDVPSARVNVFSKSLASEEGMGAFIYQSGKVVIENSRFIDNQFADIEITAEIEEGMENDYLKIVNSNFESGADYAIHSDFRCELDDDDLCDESRFIKVKNNWFNDSRGPNYSKGIEGNFEIEGFRKNDLISDPVVVIPGILGSWEARGKWKTDPILHTYDNLIESLKENGFEEDMNLFEFPYEWRNSNVLTADLLKAKLDDIRSLTGVSKVDIVAHSMGGLVAKEYIESEKYNDDINQLITLGTPHNGSPKSYMSWESGTIGTHTEDFLLQLLLLEEANHAGYWDLKEYIQDKILSLKELLPDYEYLFDIDNGKMKNYPDDYPRNTFLENLNKESAIQKLESVDFTNIIGKTDSNDTIEKFRVVESSVSGKWEHGMPENFYDQTTDQGIEYGEGDETVPYSSAIDVPYDKIIELDSSHGDLPTKAQCQVLKELTAKEDCTYISTLKRITNILTFRLFSPIDVQIISPSGQRIGKDFDTGDTFNEIENAFYSGYGTENEFITIPDPEDGDYQILTQGTGSGEYAIKADQIKEYDDGTSASRNILNRTGTAEVGGLESFLLDFEDTDFKDGSETTLIATGSSMEDLKNDSSSDKKASEKHSSSTSGQENSIFPDPSQNSLLVGFSNPLQKENYPSQAEPAESSEVRGISDEKKTNWLLNIFFIGIAIVFSLATPRLVRVFLKRRNT